MLVLLLYHVIRRRKIIKRFCSKNDKRIWCTVLSTVLNGTESTMTIPGVRRDGRVFYKPHQEVEASTFVILPSTISFRTTRLSLFLYPTSFLQPTMRSSTYLQRTSWTLEMPSIIIIFSLGNSFRRTNDICIVWSTFSARKIDHFLFVCFLLSVYR